MLNNYFVYIMASKRNGTLYTGMTNELAKRIWEHKTEASEGFTRQYGVKTLVYYETHNDSLEAIKREKELNAGTEIGNWN